MTNYVSAVPLKELGLGLGLEHLNDEQAQELTDDYSLPALKVKAGADARKRSRIKAWLRNRNSGFKDSDVEFWMRSAVH